MLGHAAPTPNPFTEERVNAELEKLDSLLSIRWFPTVMMTSNGTVEGRYGLVCRWPMVDKRWEGVTNPEDAVDIMGWFCEDLQDASTIPQDPEAILSRVLDLLGNCDNTAEPWAKRMKRAIETNKRVQDKLKEEAMDMAVDVAADHYYHTSRAARVFMGGEKDVRSD